MRRESMGDKEAALLDRFRRAAADDLRLLYLLHDREPDKETLEALRQWPVQEQLGLALRSQMGREAAALLDDALRELPDPIDAESIDALAADYADIYLTHAYRASPCESVWLDDDGLARQEPMFEVRRWFRERGLGTADASKRPDDHLIFQLQFVAHLLDSMHGDDTLRDAARFMDEHLLRWIGQFGGRVAAQCPQGFYVGLMLLTVAYLEELRDLLADFHGEARPSREEVDKRMASKSRREPEPRPYIPGAEPSW